MFYWIGLAAVLTTQTPLTLLTGVASPEPVAFAAEELRNYIEAATGTAVVIETSATWAHTNLLALAAPRFDKTSARFPKSDDPEAYRIYTPAGGGRVFTANSPRAVLYGVYDFLETSLGYRWYFPYPEDNITPTVSRDVFQSLLAFEEDREEAPAFSFRSREFRDLSPLTAGTDDRIVQQIDWWGKLRMNRFLLNFQYAGNAELWERWRHRLIPEIKRRGMLVGLGEHGAYPLFLPPHIHGKEHPDWYCEIDGKRLASMHTESGEWAQFCTTNAAAVAAYLENFSEFVRDHPEVDFYYPAPNDIGRWCACAECAKVSVADRYLRLNNKTAEAINAVRPGTRIMHLAYGNHRLPPEATVPHPLIDVDVACWGRDFAWPLCDPRTMPEDPDYLDVFHQWQALCRRQPEREKARLLYHWKIMRHYWLGLHLLPLSVMDDDFACISELGIEGFDLPLAYLGIWTRALNAYVAANKTWNPSLPAEALTARFMEEYYGDHAGDARRAYNLVAEAFRDRRYGRSLALAWFPDTSKVRDTPLEGLGENARHAVARLEEALACVAPHLAGEGPVAKRFLKLHRVLRHARDEQKVLVELDALMRACHALRLEESDAARTAAMHAWETAKAANDALAANYSPEEDEAGLYWGGASHKQLGDALAGWRLLIERWDWRAIGQWQTDDFNNSTDPISKRFDVTDMLSATWPKAAQIRFRYTGGELGASLRRVALLQTEVQGLETVVAEDRHGGFAGYVHENAVYTLPLHGGPAPGAQYTIEVELAAYAASGSVAARGCNGNVLLGLPSAPCAAGAEP